MQQIIDRVYSKYIRNEVPFLGNEVIIIETIGQGLFVSNKLLNGHFIERDIDRFIKSCERDDNDRCGISGGEYGGWCYEEWFRSEGGYTIMSFEEALKKYFKPLNNKEKYLNKQ